jgi:hypothetical protein
LRPGGAHVFTIPWCYWKPTLVRAARDGVRRPAAFRPARISRQSH